MEETRWFFPLLLERALFGQDVRDLEAEPGAQGGSLTWCGETPVGLGRALTSVLTVTG